MSFQDGIPAPSTKAQAEALERVEALAREIVAWCVEEGGRDHRRRPDPRTAPQYPALREAIQEFTKLYNEGK